MATLTVIVCWPAAERLAKREASQSVRFSRRNFRQRQQQLQPMLQQQLLTPKLQVRAAAR